MIGIGRLNAHIVDYFGLLTERDVRGTNNENEKDDEDMSHVNDVGFFSRMKPSS